MAHVRRKVFHATGLSLHRYDAAAKRWESIRLPDDPVATATQYQMHPTTNLGGETVRVLDGANLEMANGEAAALDEIKFHTGINTDAVLIEDRSLTKAINDWVDAQDQLDDTSLQAPFDGTVGHQGDALLGV